MCDAAVMALCNLILFFAFPGRTYYTTPALLMPKFYANTILVVLNSRFQILGGRSTLDSSSMLNMNSIPTYLVRDSDNGGNSGNSRTLQSSVVIKREVFTDHGVDDRSIELKGLNVRLSEGQDFY